MKKYPTRQSKKRVSFFSSVPKRSRNKFSGSFVMKVRSVENFGVVATGTPNPVSMLPVLNSRGHKHPSPYKRIRDGHVLGKSGCTPSAMLTRVNGKRYKNLIILKIN